MQENMAQFFKNAKIRMYFLSHGGLLQKEPWCIKGVLFLGSISESVVGQVILRGIWINIFIWIIMHLFLPFLPLPLSNTLPWDHWFYSQHLFGSLCLWPVAQAHRSFRAPYSSLDTLLCLFWSHLPTLPNYRNPCLSPLATQNKSAKTQSREASWTVFPIKPSHSLLTKSCSGGEWLAFYFSYFLLRNKLPQT